MATTEIAVRESVALQEIIEYGLQIEDELYGSFPGGKQAFFTRAEQYVAQNLVRIDICEANRFRLKEKREPSLNKQPKNRKLISDDGSRKKIISSIMEAFPELKIVRYSFFEKLVYCAYISDLQSMYEKQEKNSIINTMAQSFRKTKSRTERFSQDPLEMIMTLVRLLQKCETCDEENDNRVAKVIGRILEGWENGSFSGYDYFYDEMTSAGFTEETISEVWD